MDVQKDKLVNYILSLCSLEIKQRKAQGGDHADDWRERGGVRRTDITFDPINTSFVNMSLLVRVMEEGIFSAHKQVHIPVMRYAINLSCALHLFFFDLVRVFVR